MKKLKMAMVGGGIGAFIGRIHRQALRMNGDVDIVAGLFNRDAKQNREVGDALGIAPDRLYASWEELVKGEAARVGDDRIDFVTICTPNHLHYPIAKACLEAGFNVMCEKPVTLTVRESETLRRIVEKKNLVFGLMHTYTGYPMVKLAHDLVKRGDIGNVCKVVLEYQQGSFRKMDFSQPLDKRNKWKMDPKCSGSSCCMGDIGVHGANLIEYVTDLRIESLLADVSSFAPGNPLDDDGTVLLRMVAQKPSKSGAALPPPKGVLISSKVATGEENGIRLRVYGDKKSLYWSQEDPNYLRVKAQREPEQIWKRGNPYVKEVSEGAARATRPPAGHPEGFIEAFANHYAEFCADIRQRKSGKRAPKGMAYDYPGIDDGVRGMRFIEGVVKSSAKNGRWVRV